MRAEKQHFTVLDSWRGIAALIVALVHFRINSHIAAWDVLDRASLCVDFFFVLSGFVIFANYAARLQSGYSFWRFMGLRFGRLYPLHFIVLCAFIGWELLQIVVPALQGYAKFAPFGQPGESPYDIFLSVFLLQGLGTAQKIGFNEPSWSISAEFFTYALFALILIGFKARAYWVSLIMLIIAAGILIISKVYLTFALDYSFWRCVYGFSFGSLCWWAYERFPLWRQKFSDLKVFVASAIEVSILVICYGLFVLPVSNLMIMMCAPFVFGAMIFVFSFERGFISRVLKQRFFLVMGLSSYSIYMVHTFLGGKLASAYQLIESKTGYKLQIVIDGETMLGADFFQGDTLTLIYVVMVLVVAVISYYLIEQPGRQLSRRILK